LDGIDPERAGGALGHGRMIAMTEQARGLFAAIRQQPPACPELDCLRGRLPHGTLHAAARRAATLGVGADRVLLADHAISEEDYVLALAASLDVPFEPLLLPRDSCPLTDDQLVDAARTGLVMLRPADEWIVVVAPQGLTARRLVTGELPIPLTRFCLTTGARLRRFIAGHGASELAERAAEDLRNARPELSAAPRGWRLGIGWLTAAAAYAATMIVLPRAASVATTVALSFTFLAWTALRLIGAATAWHAWRAIRIDPHDLPVYTVIVALYDEADAAEALIAALRSLEYPHEKLQIILALEPDDLPTRDVLDRLDLGPPFEIVIAPDSGPRTKPKALNAALAFARGSFTAVFDAEDRPAPDQFHRALDAFLGSAEPIACVQARLTIDNTHDGWLARMFTAEYAGLFDVLLPGLSQRRLPLPLGGSSNHFRTDVLRAVGGWDPYNVTEDADLGMRLARLGYRTAVIASTTYEEAPARTGAWLRQRTRWFKGWIQTWAVHMRSPLRLLRDLGLTGFLAFQLVVGGTVLSALVHPIFLVLLAASLAGGLAPFASDPTAILLATLSGSALVAGYLTSATLGLIGLKRRGLLRQAHVLLLMPLHWVLLSAAAWRALWQLMRDPYRWEKTRHGLAKTSRLATESVRARTMIRIRDTSSDRPQLPPAAV
jgi:cellulose synthase/poly-beta-1,6-N-acetylglucosamine synthase-like glycosyltransferase